MSTLRALPILAVLFTAAPASAQVSIWLQRGVSGFGFGTGLFVGNDATTFTLGGGYSYQGWLDFDLALGYTTYDEDTVLGQLDIVEYGLSPSVQFHPLKQSKTVPISLAITAGFTASIGDSDNFVGDQSLGSYGAGAGVSVYRFFRLAESFGMIPAAALNVNYISPYATDEVGDDFETDSFATLSLAIGAYFAYLDSSGRIWGLVPQVTIPIKDDIGADFEGDSDPVFGITLNLIFSQPPRDDPDPAPPPDPAGTP